MLNRIVPMVAVIFAVPTGLQAGETELLGAYSALEDHIDGTTTLTAPALATQAGIVTSNASFAGNTATSISASLDLVETFESTNGALFVTGGSNFTRNNTSSVSNALRHAMVQVYQAIIDDVYTATNLANHGNLLDGYKFESSSYFPRSVAPPSNPSAVYSVQVNASQPEAWGYPVQFGTEAARRPTGAYLAPGSIATVTVPSALVGKGYEIRVGAHVANLANKNTVKRLDRVTLTYPINATSVEIANPLGGGIYLEVPYGVDEGLVTLDFQNTVRSPFFSNSVARQTSLAEWQNTERNHLGPWADFETDKFMLTVPTDWIYAYNDPVTLMNNWDLAMDACSDLQGLPHVRPKTVLYCIIDVLLDAGAYSPGYPQSNDTWNPNSTSNGNQSHDYLNGPKFTNHVLYHEFGHAAFITKFNGETESVVNLFYVPVHNRMFNVPLDEAFGRSLNTNSGAAMNRKHAALNWVVTDKFRNGQAMAATDMKYQHRGYGKYVEIAGLFGWDALGDFWKSVAVDYENGIEYPRNSDPADSRIIRMSRAAGANLLPLIEFWGVHAGSPSTITNTLAGEGIYHSAAIYDRLKYYQSVVPMSAAEFTAHDNAVHNLVSVNERDWYTSMRTGWTSALGQDSIDRIQDIIDAYFPNGRPVEGLPHYEGFEDGIGGWAQATDDDYEWRRNSGGTATPGSGPEGASTGNYYLYAEGHDAGGSNKTTSFQCTFDFSVVRQTTLSFDYHMFGPYIDYLAVDVHDGTAWTNDVWIKNGQQHGSSSDAWSSATVDLTSFTGNDEVTVRFRAKNTQWNAADPAIDEIRIDVAPMQLPYAESFENGPGAWEQLSDDDYDWMVNSGGTPTAASGPIGASDGSSYLYAEGHHGLGSNKTAAVQCRFDLSAVATAEMSFDYHMYGAYIDYLAIDVHDGTNWNNDVWIRNGQQHANSSAAWSSALIDLSPFTGSSEVTVRFRTANTVWNAADPAIDNIQVTGAAPPAGPLLAHWTMDDGAGSVVTDSENHFDASMSNASWVAGLDGTALDLNGSSSTVSLPASAFDSISEEITVTMWIYGGENQPQSNSILYAVDSSGNRVLNVHLPWSNGNVYWDAGYSGGYDRINKLAATADYKGRWNHWAFSKNATTGTMSIYLNGALWHSGSGKSRTIDGIAAATLGSQISGVHYDGLLDDVQLYNVSLNATEVSDLYQSYTVVNGVPVAWLLGYGLDPTNAAALADTDGDGLANWEEYAAGKDPLVSDNPPGLRVNEYYLTTGDFAGTTAMVTLSQALADDYYILVRGSRTGSGLSLPNNDYARVTAVPYAVGDMNGSGATNLLELSRSVVDFDWEGVVTVVECTNPSSTSGFKLVDILSTSLTGTSGTDSSASWSDVNQVVLFGGYRGGGASFVGTPTSRNQGTSVYTRLFPSGSNTLNWSRNAGGETLVDAAMTTFVVEWGSAWNVQRVNVAGSSGGNGADATSEYSTANISSVNRDNTWVWGTGTRADAGIGDSSEACLVTLGDGVNQNATESTVSVGSEYSDAFDFDVYTMTHSGLAVDYRFKSDGDSGATDLAVTVDNAASGTRMGWVYNGVNGTGTYFSRPRMWARYTADGEVTISRGFSGQDFPAWVQGIDFSGVNN